MFCEALAVRIRDDVAAALELAADRVQGHARAEGARRHHDHRPCLRPVPASGLDPFDDVSLELLRFAAQREMDEVRPGRAAGVGRRAGLRARAARSARCSRPRSRATTPGYADSGRLPEAFAGFAGTRFGWQVDPERVRLVADIMSAVAELLRALTEPGDGVVVNPPVYPPFFVASREAGRRVVEVPLLDRRRAQLDLDGSRARVRGGAHGLSALPPAQPDRHVVPRERSSRRSPSSRPLTA